MERTKIEFSIEVPIPLDFSQRERVRKAAVQKAFEEIDSISEEQLKVLFAEICERTANRFDLTLSFAICIVEYVLSISDRYSKLLSFTNKGSEN